MRWTVKRKLIAIFSIMMGLILGMSGTGIFSAYQLNENTRTINYSIIPKIEYINHIEKLTQNVISLSQRHVLSKDVEFAENYARQIEDSVAEVEQQLEQYELLLAVAHEQYVLSEVKLNWNTLVQEVEEVIALSSARQAEEATVKSYAAVATTNKIGEGVQTLSELHKEELQTVETAGEQLYTGVLITLLSGTILAIILSIIGIFYLLKTIQRPIVQLSHNFTKMAEGDLTVSPLNFTTKDEIGQLGRDFNVMHQQLKNLMEELQQGVVVLGETSTGFAHITDNSRQSGEQITTAIREVSAGAATQLDGARLSNSIVDNMASQTEEAVQSTQKVSQVALEASTMTQEGAKMMDTAVEKMNDIQLSTNQTSSAMGVLSNKSSEVGTIVTMITKIANQTNLLALNAAIEAARAGEHGKGFSVVASEVGQLAAQSGQAASEISQLIEEIQEEVTEAIAKMEISKTDVQEGLTIVEQSGQQFTTIAEHVQEVSKQGVMVAQIVQGIFDQTEQVKQIVDDVAIMAEQADGRAHHIVKAAEKQNETMAQLLASSKVLNEMAESLHLRISKYEL